MLKPEEVAYTIKHEAIIMRGLPGSGKSTYIKKFYPDAVVCSADHFFEVDGEYRFDFTKLGMAHLECYKKFSTSLSSGHHQVVCDNTNLTLMELSPYIMEASRWDYDIKIIHICMNNLEKTMRNVHDVSQDKILAMSRKYQKLPAHWIRYQVVVDN